MRQAQNTEDRSRVPEGKQLQWGRGGEARGWVRWHLGMMGLWDQAASRLLRMGAGAQGPPPYGP